MTELPVLDKKTQSDANILLGVVVFVILAILAMMTIRDHNAKLRGKYEVWNLKTGDSWIVDAEGLAKYKAVYGATACFKKL